MRSTNESYTKITEGCRN